MTSAWEKPAHGKRPKQHKYKPRTLTNPPQLIEQQRRVAVVDIVEMNKVFQQNGNVDSPPLHSVPQLKSTTSLEATASLQEFYQSISVDIHTDSDWDSNEEEEEEEEEEDVVRPATPDDILSPFTPPTPEPITTSRSEAFYQPRHRPSVEHFRIKSVTVFGDMISNSGLNAFIKDMKEQKKKQIDDAWKEKRKFIENELIETEKHYAHDLNVLCNEILNEIFKQKLLDEKYRAQVTSNLPQIASFHSEYLLKELMEGDIIQVFNNRADFLKMYTIFVKQYPDILDIFAVHGTKSKNKKLYKFLKQKRKEKKPLTNLLISPIQRIPRYLLLLQDIKKRTPVDYKDYDDIEEALNKVKDITNHINERQKEIENMSQCLQFQSKLRGFKGKLVEPHRKYINQFTFNFEKGKKLKLNQFCVFSDTVIITDAKWNVIQNIKMRSMNIKKIQNEKHGKGFELKNIGIYFDTQETMNDDVDEIYEAIQREKEVLLQNDMNLFNAENNRVQSEINRIKAEDLKQKTGMFKKLKGNKSGKDTDDVKESKTKKSKKALALENQSNIWGRTLKRDDTTKIMTVQWNFVDINDDQHCVVLQHQQIKGNPNKKSKRIIIIDSAEVFSSNKSKQNEFKFDLSQINRKLKRKKVILLIEIKYNEKKNRYSYPLLIDGKRYPTAFNEWQSANKS